MLATHRTMSSSPGSAPTRTCSQMLRTPQPLLPCSAAAIRAQAIAKHPASSHTRLPSESTGSASLSSPMPTSVLERIAAASHTNGSLGSLF